MALVSLRRLVPHRPLAEVQLLDQPGVPQEDQRAVHRRQVQARQAARQPRPDLLGRQVLLRLVEQIPDELALRGQPRASGDHLGERMMTHDAEPPDRLQLYWDCICTNK